MTRTLAQELVSAIAAANRCAKTGNSEWQVKWTHRVDDLMAYMPSGSGVDAGVSVEWDKCTLSKLVLSCEFHHMNDAGMYDGGTSHRITVTPAFDGIDVTVSGRNRNGIKDYLCELFQEALLCHAPEMAHV